MIADYAATSASTYSTASPALGLVIWQTTGDKTAAGETSKAVVGVSGRLCEPEGVANRSCAAVETDAATDSSAENTASPAIGLWME